MTTTPPDVPVDQRIQALRPGDHLWVRDPYTQEVSAVRVKGVGASVIADDRHQRWRRMDHPDVAARWTELHPRAVGTRLHMDRRQYAYADRRDAIIDAIAALHRAAERWREEANNADVQAEAYLRQLGEN